MILELGDNRELKLPDDMDEDTARLLGRLILVTEKRAADAEQANVELQGQIDTLRGELRAMPMADPAPSNSEGAAAAIKEMQQAMETALARVARLAGADRVIVYDSLGTPRSRVAL